MVKTAVVTGGSSGIGRATAAELYARGYAVYEFSRHEAPQTGVTHIFADITASDTVAAAVAEVIAEAGRIDLLVNNAGSGISGAVEFTDTDSAKKLFDVLFLGADTVTRACIPHLRASRGRIINISSVAAALPIPFQTYYSAGKAAINTYTMALANELHRFGVSVCAVMPGDTHTGFTDARRKQAEGDGIYGGAVSRSVGRMEKDERHGSSPEKAARFIARVAEKKSVKPLYAIGAQYKLFCVLAKALPCRFVNFILRKMYA